MRAVYPRTFRVASYAVGRRVYYVTAAVNGSVFAGVSYKGFADAFRACLAQWRLWAKQTGRLGSEAMSAP